MAEYVPLALRYRPLLFKDVIYNDHIVSILKNMVIENKIPNGIIFSGIRGIGKTTLARILARAINCSNLTEEGEACGECENCQLSLNNEHPDIIEIDGASHGNIDDVRKLLDNIELSPMISRKKIFIVDEAHNLARSQASFEALLKVLEEPPPHIMWIFCTTKLTKIPDTIKSRLVCLNLRSIPVDLIAESCENIIALQMNLEQNDYEEQIEEIKDCALIIARAAKNSIRDALTIIERVAPYCNENGWVSEVVSGLVGSFDPEHIREILNFIVSKDAGGLWGFVEKLLDNGVDPDDIMSSGFLEPISNLLTMLLGAYPDLPEIYNAVYGQIPAARLKYLASSILASSKNFYESTNKRMSLQLAVLELTA